MKMPHKGGSRRKRAVDHAERLRQAMREVEGDPDVRSEAKPDDPPELDYDALNSVSRLIGYFPLDTDDVSHPSVPYLRPIREFADHTEFDRIICGAGVKIFVRPAMASDRPGSGTPINPKTREPDPSISVPDIPFGPEILVIQLKTGIRIRRSVSMKVMERGRHDDGV
jgi:hypothetical protein